MTITTIKGTWYTGDGFRADLAPRVAAVEIIDGKAYDPELGQGFGPLPIEGDEVRGWADAYFSADAGELARVGLA